MVYISTIHVSSHVCLSIPMWSKQKQNVVTNVNQLRPLPWLIYIYVVRWDWGKNIQAPTIEYTQTACRNVGNKANTRTYNSQLTIVRKSNKSSRSINLFHYFNNFRNIRAVASLMNETFYSYLVFMGLIDANMCWTEIKADAVQ